MSLIRRYLDWNLDVTARFSGVMVGFLDLIALGILGWIVLLLGPVHGAIYLFFAGCFLVALFFKLQRPVPGAVLSRMFSVSLLGFEAIFGGLFLVPIAGVAVFSVVSASQRVLLRHRLQSQEYRA